jgi:hypothetical protein
MFTVQTRKRRVYPYDTMVGFLEVVQNINTLRGNKISVQFPKTSNA